MAPFATSPLSGKPLSRWHRLVLGRLVFAVLPLAYILVAAPAVTVALAPQLAAGPEPVTIPLDGSEGIEEDRGYVLDNQWLTTEAPATSQQDGPQQVARWAGTLTVTADLLASRLIVVGSQGEIVGIWSNTTVEDSGFYSLTAREGSRNGDAHPLTATVLYNYSELLDTTDWSFRGQVYP